MSDAVLIALITAGGGSVGAVLLFIQRRLPPRPATARDVAITEVWEELRVRGEEQRVMRTELDDVIRERDAEHLMVTILTDATDALTAAVERAKPPVVLTPSEQQKIDRALAARRARDEAAQHPRDDSAWPTLGGRPT